MDAYLARVRGKPVLSITDAADERKPRGTINFVVVENRVRFEIDLDMAAEHRLTLSSKLASLAVRTRPAR